MKRLLIILLKVGLWTVPLPLVGFSVFTTLTFFPIFGLFLGSYLLIWIYAVGAAPCFITALCYELWFKRMRFPSSLLCSCVAGFSATIGCFMVLYGLPDPLAKGGLYVMFALGFSGAFAAAIMPLMNHSWQNSKYVSALGN